MELLLYQKLHAVMQAGEQAETAAGKAETVILYI
jgi:hypothetical protein